MRWASIAGVVRSPWAPSACHNNFVDATLLVVNEPSALDQPVRPESYPGWPHEHAASPTNSAAASAKDTTARCLNCPPTVHYLTSRRTSIAPGAIVQEAHPALHRLP